LTVADSVEGRRSWRAWLRLGVIALAVAYPVALLLVFLALRSIGERWSVTTLALYLPRVGFGLPLPFLTMALCFVKPRRWLLTEVCAAALLLFPSWASRCAAATRRRGRPQLRIMSFNIDLAPTDSTELVDAIRATASDIVCLQEAQLYEAARFAQQMPGWVVREDGQFLVASSTPSSTSTGLELPAGLRGARLELHPLPRRRARRSDRRLQHASGLAHSSFDRLRASGLGRELASGHFFVNYHGYWHLQHNAGHRAMQVSALARHAAASPYPVIIMATRTFRRAAPCSRESSAPIKMASSRRASASATRTRPGRGCPGSASIGSWRTSTSGSSPSPASPSTSRPTIRWSRSSSG